MNSSSCCVDFLLKASYGGGGGGRCKTRKGQLKGGGNGEKGKSLGRGFPKTFHREKRIAKEKCLRGRKDN